MYCAKCGTPLPPETNYCPQCQHPVQQSTVPPTPQEPPAPTSPQTIIIKDDRPSNLSITAFVCGLLSFLCCFFPSIISIIIGVLELSNISKGYSSVKGRFYAITGLVLGILSYISPTCMWVCNRWLFHRADYDPLFQFFHW
jgi:hypothetical protein